MTIKYFFHRVNRKLIKLISPSVSWLFSKMIKTDEYKIVFDNFAGQGFGNNPKYIAQEILRQKLPVTIIWLVESGRQEAFPTGIVPVNLYSLRAIYERCKAKLWIDNVRVLYPVCKKDDQLYLQVWHGPSGLKRTEKSAEGSLNWRYIAAAKHDGEICDAILSNSVAQTELFRRDYWLSQKTEILEYGLPINDYIIRNRDNQAVIRELRRQNRLSDDHYIVVYAPTFRDDGSLEPYNLDFPKIIETFERKTNKTCTLIIKLHPNLINIKLPFTSHTKMIDAGDLPYRLDLQTLALLADCVISDYSTAIFDFICQKKPAFLCAMDLESYGKTRGLMIEHYYALPCVVNTSCQELISDINSFDARKYDEAVSAYYSRFPDFDDGHAAERIVNWIRMRLFPRECAYDWTEQACEADSTEKRRNYKL